MAIDKSKTIMRSFITSNIAYCLLVWMLHDQCLINKINSANKKALKNTYLGKILRFKFCWRK